MITHGTPADWIVWGFMIAVGLGAALGCYRMGRSIGDNGQRYSHPTYAALAFAFVCVTYLVLLHAPFHVG